MSGCCVLKKSGVVSWGSVIGYIRNIRSVRMGAYKNIIFNFVEVFISSHGCPNMLIDEYVTVVGLPTSCADGFFCASPLEGFIPCVFYKDGSFVFFNGWWNKISLLIF